MHIIVINTTNYWSGDGDQYYEVGDLESIFSGYGELLFPWFARRFKTVFSTDQYAVITVIVLSPYSTVHCL